MPKDTIKKGKNQIDNIDDIVDKKKVKQGKSAYDELKGSITEVKSLVMSMKTIAAKPIILNIKLNVKGLGKLQSLKDALSFSTINDNVVNQITDSTQSIQEALDNQLAGKPKRVGNYKGRKKGSKNKAKQVESEVDTELAVTESDDKVTEEKLKNLDVANEVETGLVEEQEDKKKGSLRRLFEYMTRWRRILNKQDMDEFDKETKKKGEILKDMLKGALAGFTLGKLADMLMPRDQLDELTKTREDFIRAYGDTKVYKGLKSSLFKQMRELNEKIGVSAFNSQDVIRGIRLAIEANIPESIAEAFAVAAVKAEKVGIRVGEGLARKIAQGFKESSDQILDTLSNVMTQFSLNDDIKTSITSAITEYDSFIVKFSKDTEQQKRSAGNLAATLAYLEDNNVMTVDQAQKYLDLIKSAGYGDTSAMETLAKLGAGGAADMAKGGNWQGAMQSVLTGLSNKPTNSTALDAMGLNFSPDEIVNIQNGMKDIRNMVTEVNSKYAEAMEIIDGMTQAEKRAAEVAESSWASRITNWLTLTPLLETASDWLEKMNINASTAATGIGILGGVMKGVWSMIMLNRMNKAVAIISGTTPKVKLLTRVARVASKGFKFLAWAIKDFFTGFGKALLSLGKSVLFLGKALWGLATNPVVLAISLIIVAIAAAIYLVYKNWDKIVAFFKKTVGYVKDLFERLGKAIKEKFGWIWEPIQKGWENLVNFFKTSLDTVKEVFKAATDAIYGAFKSIWEPIRDGFTSVRDYLAGIFEKLPGPIQKALKVIFLALNPLFLMIKGAKMIYDWWKGHDSSNDPAIDTSVQGVMNDMGESDISAMQDAGKKGTAIMDPDNGATYYTTDKNEIEKARKEGRLVDTKSGKTKPAVKSAGGAKGGGGAFGSDDKPKPKAKVAETPSSLKSNAKSSFNTVKVDVRKELKSVKVDNNDQLSATRSSNELLKNIETLLKGIYNNTESSSGGFSTGFEADSLM